MTDVTFRPEIYREPLSQEKFGDCGEAAHAIRTAL